MPRVFDRQTRQNINVPRDELEALLKSDPERFTLAEDVAVVTPETGSASTLPREQLEREFKEGRVGRLTPQALPEALNEGAARALEHMYGDGAANTAIAGAQGFARGATLGLSDLLLDAQSDDGGLALEQFRVRNEVASGVSEVVGSVVPSLLSGGAGAAGKLARATPAGLASYAAERIAAGVVGNGLGIGQKMARGALAAALEGAAFGVGQQITQIAVHDDPMTVESLATTVGLGAALGFGTGGLFAGIGAKLGKTPKVSPLDDLAAELGKADRAALALAEDTKGLYSRRVAQLVNEAPEQTVVGKVVDDAGFNAPDDLAVPGEHELTEVGAKNWEANLAGNLDGASVSDSSVMRRAFQPAEGAAEAGATAGKPLAGTVAGGGSKKGVPMMVTKQMKVDLAAGGFTDDAIRSMTPDEAQRALQELAEGAAPAAPVPSVADEVLDPTGVGRRDSTAVYNRPAAAEADSTLAGQLRQSIEQQAARAEGGTVKIQRPKPLEATVPGSGPPRPYVDPEPATIVDQYAPGADTIVDELMPRKAGRPLEDTLVDSRAAAGFGDTVAPRTKVDTRNVEAFEGTVAKGADFDPRPYPEQLRMDDVKLQGKAVIKELEGEIGGKYAQMADEARLAETRKLERQFARGKVGQFNAKAEVDEAISSFHSARKAVAKDIGEELDMRQLFRLKPKDAVEAVKRIDAYARAAGRLDDLGGRTSDVARLLSEENINSVLASKLPEGMLDKYNAMDLAALSEVLGVSNLTDRLGDVGPVAKNALRVYAAVKFMRGGSSVGRAQRQWLKSFVKGGAHALVAPATRGSGTAPRVVRNVARQMVGAVSGRVSGILGAVDGASARIQSGVVKAVEALSKPGARSAPALSAKAVLSRMSFGESKEKNVAIARMEEIREAASKPEETRSRLRLTTFPVAALNPSTGERLVAHREASIQFLASKLPPLPRGAAMSGSDKLFEPSRQEIAKWTRYVRAVENPIDTLLEDMADWRLTPEVVEAVETLYPEVFKAVQVQLMTQLGTMAKKLPYQSRVQVSLFYKVPMDPSMHPRFINTMQSLHAQRVAKSQQAAQQAPRSFGTPPAQTDNLTKAQRLEQR